MLSLKNTFGSLVVIWNKQNTNQITKKKLNSFLKTSCYLKWTKYKSNNKKQIIQFFKDIKLLVQSKKNAAVIWNKQITNQITSV